MYSVILDLLPEQPKFKAFFALEPYLFMLKKVMSVMSLRAFSRHCARLLLLLLIGATYFQISTPAHATVVRFNSLVGTFDVRMYETATPLTVANILNYVNDGDFDDSIVHRVENVFIQNPDGSFTNDPFVIQGGNWKIPDGGLITPVPSDPPVTNEPGISNLYGTMALARIGGQVNSGTNNWYVNTKDNQFLDTVDEGFTVFGRVVLDGMDVVDTIANLPVQTIRNQFNQTLGNTFPLHGDFSHGVSRENFVLFTSVEELQIPNGDYNFDGTVGGIDFLHWQSGFQSTIQAEADNNGDAIVDAADYLAWEGNFGGPMALSATIFSVPEASTGFLLCCGLGLLTLQRTRIRSCR